LDTQISCLRNYDCREIQYCADRRVFAQVAVNHEPDVAREIWNVLIDPDNIVVSFSQKAGQAGHTHPGPHSDQVLADVVQFAGHRAVASNAERSGSPTCPEPRSPGGFSTSLG
jgi:hypothetical protein